MTSRTFPLSRQRRRRIAPKGVLPVLDGDTAGGRPAAPLLPHEHDENTDPPQPPREPIIQAEADLIEGREDTDLRSKAREVFDNATRRR